MATKSSVKTNEKNAGTKQSAGKETKQAAPAQPTKTGSANTEGLQELFVDMLKDIYWAEKALTKALPKMAKNASAEELVTALKEHLSVTEEQVARLEQVFESIGKKAQAKKCEAMEGLIKEATEMMESNDAGLVRDAAIIAAGQKVEHYEIASYGTLCSLAKTLGEEEAATLLGQTLDEEKEADETLTTVAETIMSSEGEDADSDEEEEDDTDDDDEEADDESDDDDDEEEEDEDEEDSKATDSKKNGKAEANGKTAAKKTMPAGKAGSARK